MRKASASHSKGTSTAPRIVTASGGYLIPWQKGQSGNPSGRAKMAPEVLEMARAATPQAIDALVELVQHGEPDQTRLNAIVALLDRAWGKPVETSHNLNLNVDAVRYKLAIGEDPKDATSS